MNHKNFPTSHIHSCTADSIATGSIKPVKNPKPWFFLKNSCPNKPCLQIFTQKRDPLLKGKFAWGK